MRVKKFNEYIKELNTVKFQNGRRTKSVHLIYDDPSTDQSFSSSVLLKNKLKEEEFADFVKQSGLKINKSKISKIERFKVTLNNLKFLKDKKKELGILRCEYCNKGPLVIYDFTKGNKFRKSDGATCDHRNPQSRGGDLFKYDNLAVCCYNCNMVKKNMSYEEWIKIISTNESY